MTTLVDRLALVDGLEPQRIHGAAKLSALIANGTLTQVTPAAFILPLGIRGGSVDAATGLYRQSIDRHVGILLVLRSAGDATGQRGFDELGTMIEAVIGVVAGWVPGNAIDGAYRLAKGELVSLQAGLLQYQLDFILDDQLRITTP